MQILLTVKRFGIWDLGFWIDPDHKGQTILDLGYFDFAQYKFWILD
ncbi:MAG: hypothetical protein HEQ35_31595 [Gloeotrichia echinulata IR180]|nr:hypothetical protein [Gloeotrichia echinulata DEX184]